jgi:hypothetical protein
MGPCCCPLITIHLIIQFELATSDEVKLSVTKSVTVRIESLTEIAWRDHLVSDTIWQFDEAAVKQLIAASVPDTVLNQIKGGTNAKAVGMN